MANLKPIIISGFKGVNFDHPTLIADNEFADTQNMVQGSDGLWENRKGVKTFDNQTGSGKKVHSLHFWKLGDGTRYLTVGSGTALYSYAESSSYRDGTFTSRQTGFTDGEPFSFAQYKDNLIATNGAEAMYSTVDNATFTVRNGSNTRIAKYILFANDIGHCADIASARSVHYYGSAVPANPWEFANSVAIEEDNGEVLTGLTNLGPVIIDGKYSGATNGSTYSVDVATPQRSQIDHGGGIVSHRSITKSGNSVYFASGEGIFTLGQRSGTTSSGTSSSLESSPISSPVQGLWDRLVSKVGHANTPGVYHYPTQSIYWGVRTAEQEFALVYNVRFGTWSYLVGVIPNDWTIYEDSSGDPHLLYGDRNTDNVRELFHPDRDDDGAPINSVLTTKRFNFNTMLKKNTAYVILAGYGSDLMSLDVEIFYDDEIIASTTATVTSAQFLFDPGPTAGSLASGSLASGALTGSVIASDDLEVTPWVIKIPLGGKDFRSIQIKMSNSQSGVRWRFRHLEIQVGSEPDDNFETNLLA